jgi:replicative superfamily II helicase
MKALASEIVRKLGKRLQWLSIQVRELTGMLTDHDPQYIFKAYPQVTCS